MELSEPQLAMTKLELIEKDIKELSPKELVKFRAWFTEYDADAWDDQIEADVVSGKLKTLRDEALSEYSEGESKPL